MEVNQMVVGAWRLEEDPKTAVPPEWKWEHIYFGLSRPKGQPGLNLSSDYYKSEEFQARFKAIHQSRGARWIFYPKGRMARAYTSYDWSTKHDRFVLSSFSQDLTKYPAISNYNVLEKVGDFFRVRITQGTLEQRREMAATSSEIADGMDVVVQMRICPNLMETRGEDPQGNPSNQWSRWHKIPLKGKAKP